MLVDVPARKQLVQLFGNFSLNPNPKKPRVFGNAGLLKDFGPIFVYDTANQKIIDNYNKLYF